MCKCFITYRGANAPYKNHSKARNGISVFVVNQFMLIILLLDLHLCTFLCRARSWSCLFYAGGFDQYIKEPLASSLAFQWHDFSNRFAGKKSLWVCALQLLTNDLFVRPRYRGKTANLPKVNLNSESSYSFFFFFNCFNTLDCFRKPLECLLHFVDLQIYRCEELKKCLKESNGSD